MATLLDTNLEIAFGTPIDEIVRKRAYIWNALPYMAFPLSPLLPESYALQLWDFEAMSLWKLRGQLVPKITILYLAKFFPTVWPLFLSKSP